jgi:hypothetical protein
MPGLPKERTGLPWKSGPSGRRPDLDFVGFSPCHGQAVQTRFHPLTTSLPSISHPGAPFLARTLREKWGRWPSSNRQKIRCRVVRMLHSRSLNRSNGRDYRAESKEWMPGLPKERTGLPWKSGPSGPRPDFDFLWALAPVTLSDFPAAIAGNRSPGRDSLKAITRLDRRSLSRISIHR